MKKLLPLLALFILFAWGCEKSEKKEETKKTTSQEETTAKTKIVARVNGKPIYEEDLRGRSLQDAIDNEILYEVGLKQGVGKKVEKTVEDYRKRLIVTTIQNEIRGNIPKEVEVSDQEIEAYYNENKGKYQILRLQEISVEDKNLAEEIHKKALGGEEFQKIASDYSKSGTNVAVKDLGYNRRYNNAFSGKEEVGSVSEVIQEGNQFKILKLIEVKEIPLDRAKQAIKYNILAKRRAQSVHEYAEKTKNEYQIKVEILEEKK